MVNFCKSNKCLIGKTAIITGANTGIGYETALDFAKRGCRVIMACRNQEKATTAKENIIKATGNTNIIIKSLNLELLASVKDFAQDIIDTEDRLDLLVNNAGAGYLPNEITADGLQLEMATNYFSHFLLTNLLIDILKKSIPSRIINVSSVIAKLTFNLDVNKLNEYNGDVLLYSKSKLCNIYFTQELGKRLKGTGVTAYSLHPGIISTEFLRAKPVMSFVVGTFFLNSLEGAQTQIYVSLEDGIEKHNGEHFENCRPVKPYYAARNAETRRQLWKISEEMVGLKQ